MEAMGGGARGGDSSGVYGLCVLVTACKCRNGQRIYTHTYSYLLRGILHGGPGRRGVERIYRKIFCTEGDGVSCRRASL